MMATKNVFYLNNLNLVRFLKEYASIPMDGEVDPEVISAIYAWNHSNFLCRNNMLNGLSDSLYNV